MRRDDALHDEMHGHTRNSVPPLDPYTAERMLDGAIDPDDVPPDYRDLVRVLAAAAAAPAVVDPVAEAAAGAVFRSAPPEAGRGPRKISVLGRLISVKAIAAVAVGAVSAGTAAAATGTLPDAAQAAAHRLVAVVPDADREPRPTGDPARRVGGSGSAGLASRSPAGTAGLCRAYLSHGSSGSSGSGSEDDQGGRLDATALRRLAEAAGSAERVAAYCTGVTAAARDTALPGPSAGTHPDLTRQCRAWLAAEQEDDTARLGTSVLDRLASVAGGADSVAGYCTALVGPARAGDQPGVQRPRPSKAPDPPGSEGPPAAPSDGAHPESQGEQG